ncbi:MAG: TldD/PmbA family protein [Candidatus Cloacimonetes bacterium]|nr:TldD/PmbA family protein [Candidatus Cloacimonadota bacterium]
MHDSISYLHQQLKSHPELKYEISSLDWQTDFLRFYHSQTNYNISKHSIQLAAKLFLGKKSYGFKIMDPDAAKIDEALATALEIMPNLSEDPDFVDVEDDLAKAPERKQPNNLIAIPLELKTEILAHLAKATEPYDFEIYGTFICNFVQGRLINSKGLDKESSNSPIYLEVKAVHKKSQITVLETFGGEDFAYFNKDEFTTRLLKKMQACANPVVDIEPGHYDVILAPRCLAEFTSYLGYGMGARALDQHSSYFEDKLNTQVFPEWINITDDPGDPELIHRDYGSGGKLYRPLKLVEKGVFRAFLCDNYYHHKTGLPNNGNTASCLVIDTGDKSLEEMIAKVKNGLYISSLHYMNFINPKETSLTGLTRDGTFLIKDGKITNVVVNLRFTEKIDRIISSITALENRSYAVPFSENYHIFDIETIKAPHALVSAFNITSSTHQI